MKSDDIDNIIIWAIVLTIIVDSLVLFAELLNQRCEKKAEREQEEKEKKFNLEVENLQKRISALEKQVGTV
jgi:peptidoglycan hydrolase CwlO-like protein